MRIAQVAPLYESVPPKYYGGTERVVAYLTEELVRQGHDVTLFASGDSTTTAKLMPVCPESLRLAENCVDQLAYHVVMLERVCKHARDFDLIHFHIDYLHFPVSRRGGWRQVTTLHGRLDIPELPAVYNEFPDMPVISISNAQRTPLPQAGWVGTVYHGLPKDLHAASDQPGKYLAFLGRISREKRVDRAIDIALRSGMPLKIAAKLDNGDREYFDKIKHLFDHPLVEYVGEIGEQEKGEFLRNSYAMVFPIEWPEPFGLAMIEAMACGTPVVAYRRGSIPEVIDDGVTGFVVDSEEEAAKAVERVATLDRKRIRQVFEERFSSPRMARDYLQIYERLLGTKASERTVTRSALREHEPVLASTQTLQYPERASPLPRRQSEAAARLEE